MIKWSVSTEVFSLILLFVLILNFHERRWGSHPQRRLYQLCLYLSAGTMVVNILCTCFLSLPQVIPVWVNLLFNSAYFLMVVAVCSIVAFYLCRLLYEHIYQQDGLRRYRRLLAALYLAYALLIAVNLFTGVVFRFDAQHHYQRGPLINSGYLVMVIQLAVLLGITVRNWQSVDSSMRRVMRILPPIILALTIYQIIFPDVLLNGGIIVAADIILMVNFQSRRIEQDILTSSGNRNSLRQELLLRLGGKQNFQVLAVSLQQYRMVNQRYGTRRGDALLCALSAWLEQLHPKGKSFRMGNVEFALLVPYEGPGEADRLARAVQARLRQPWQLDGAGILPCAVLAEFLYTGQGGSADDILELLNFSLAQARCGKEHFLRFEPAIYEKIALHSRTVELLQQAVQKKRFEVWYQPIRHCPTGRFSAAEALVRMRDEAGGLVPPAQFIPIAESDGFIEEITNAVLEQVCRLLADPAADGLRSVSVNLSAQQLLTEDMVRRLDELQRTYGFAPQRLCLEVTERVLSENPDAMRSTMELLMRRGYSFALDDFGAGQSNLSLILENSFSRVKLDHSLIQDYPESERAVFIVHTMLEMFQGMRCPLIVEGVERPEQARALTGHGVEWIQGFYYARPMPRAELMRLLAGDAAKPRPAP